VLTNVEFVRRVSLLYLVLTVVPYSSCFLFGTCVNSRDETGLSLLLKVHRTPCRSVLLWYATHFVIQLDATLMLYSLRYSCIH
jgi:hypothetical protein